MIRHFLISAALSALLVARLAAASHDDDDGRAAPPSVSQLSSGKAAKAVTRPADDDDALSSADDYLGGTEVYQTQEKGECEFQADMFLGRNRQVYSGEIEYGITDEFMISFGTGYRREADSEEAGDSDEAGSSGLTSTWTGECELRYRLPHHGAWPCDIAFALDLSPHFVHSQATQWFAEPRLILQRTFDSLTLTSNVGAELGRYSTLEFSGGFLYRICPCVAVGGEILYDTRDRELDGIPQIFVSPTRQITIVFGYSFTNTPSLNTWDASLRLDF